MGNKTIKIGMILECGPQGADVKVCEKFARQLHSENIKIITRTLDDKPNLINDCGKVASLLLKEGCDRVLIIWDLYPSWRENKVKPCRKEDCDAIQESLENAGVKSTNVYLICIEAELEEWFLHDTYALSSVLSTPPHPVNIRKKLNGGTNPKAVLIKTFKEHTGRLYNDLYHAEKIANAISDLNKLKKCPSFVRFALKVADKRL